MLRTTVLLSLVAASCAAPTSTDAPADARPAERAAAARAELARMFPELEGEVTRASIEALLADRTGTGPQKAGPAGDDGASDPALEEAIAALRAGRLDEAHERVGTLLTTRLLRRAKELLAEGNPRDALSVLDDAVDVSPRDPEVQRMRAEGALALGLELGDPTFLEDALASFRTAARIDGDARAWIGASRAARELFRTDDAIDFARRALSGSGGTAVEASVSTAAQRALGQATFDKYIATRQEGGTPEDVQELFETTRRALETYLERAPEDAWGWTQLANLYEWQGALADARRVLLEGLDRLPSDEALHARLVDVSRKLGGAEAVYESYDEFRSRHGDELLGDWFPAVERFQRAVQGYAQGEDTSAGFEAARQAFEKVRLAAPEWADRCAAYEVVCKSGIGWCRLRTGDLDDAKTAFLGMEHLEGEEGSFTIADGLRYEVEGLRSGVDGLALVADASYRRGLDPNSIERADHMRRASSIFDYLHLVDDRNVDWANNAGFFNRDTAVLYEQRARALARQGEIEEANRHLARARELMEKSYLAYVDAHELAPDDVRIANDAGLILTHYLQRDVQEAERLLMRAVELGEEQVPAARAALEEPDLGAEELERRRDELETLEIALGDAYENLARLHLTLKGRPDVARRWCQKALEEGGPDPRPIVDEYLRSCAQAERGELDPKVTDKTRWGAPIAR